MTTASPQRNDGAAYPTLEAEVRGYLRDAAAALDAIYAVVGAPEIVSFSCEMVESTQPWGESVWQEVAVTDGRRLILWHGEEEAAADGAPSPVFISSLRTIPLTAIADQNLRLLYGLDDEGQQSLQTVSLRLSTQTPERSLTELTEESGARSTQYVETYWFSKSLNDGGPDQMVRLIEFGHALSRSAGAARAAG